MKLSEKLAALEEEEGRDAGPESDDEPPRRSKPIRAKDGGSPWDETKRKVRALVLEEIADKIKELDADERETELRNALDRILQREDISVTPLERRRFVAEMVADTLGLRPPRPAPGRPRHHRGDVQRLRRHLGGEGGEAAADRDQVHRRQPVPPGHREDRVLGGPPRRRVLPHGRCPPPRRLPRQRHRPAARHPRRRAHDPEVLQGSRSPPRT